jgi:hypothetical protein
MVAYWVLAAPRQAHAAFLHGETLDTAAEVLSWIVMVLVPVVGIAVFWLVHILPEKVAEKRKHPQAKAIQCLCLLSLFFGGLLWPIAWLWAYSKPVLYKLAYGTDKEEPHEPPPEPKPEPKSEKPAAPAAAAPALAATKPAKEGGQS